MGYQGETRDINSVEFHPELSHNGHPLDGALAGALWPQKGGIYYARQGFYYNQKVRCHKHCALVKSKIA